MNRFRCPTARAVRERTFFATSPPPATTAIVLTAGSLARLYFGRASDTASEQISYLLVMPNALKYKHN
jgi:hypothetical protein